MTSIGDWAFWACSGLTSVVIGDGVKTINSYAFANCPELTDVTCNAENVPSTESNAFDGSGIEYATLHVPTASIDAYKTTVPWSGFKTVMGLDGTLPEGIVNVPAKANDGERITVYSINGTQAGSAIINGGSAVINTNLQPYNVAIVRIGQKSVKMMVK